MSVKDRVYISTSCVDGDRHITTVLERMVSMSIMNIELSGPHPFVPYDRLISELLSYKDIGVSFIVHNYFPPPKSDFVLNIASLNDEIVGENQTLIHNALDLACKLQALFYSCHAGYLADAKAHSKGLFQFDIASMQSPETSLVQAANIINEIIKNEQEIIPSGGILIENLFPVERSTPLSLACTPDEMKALLDMIDNSIVGILLDLAHFELTCNTYNLNPDIALDTLLCDIGDRVKAIHLSGHDGRTDIHMPLEPKSWQLKAARMLNTMPANGNELKFTLESRGMDDATLLAQLDMILDSLE